MKKFLAMMLALVMALSLVACGEQGDSQKGDDSASGDKVVKIGVFEPQSGDNGAGGKQEILGMQYANKMIPTVTIGGEEYKVELVYADNASSNDKAPTAAQTLISQGVSVVLGSYGSGVSIAAGDTFSAAQVPAIGVGKCTADVLNIRSGPATDLSVLFTISEGNMVDVLEDNGRGWLRIRCLLGTGWCSAQYIDWSRHDK